MHWNSSQAEVIERNSSKKETTMESTSLYSTKFSNSFRNSYVDTKTSAIGKIAWIKPTGFTASKYWPATVLLWSKHQLVSTYEDIVLFDSNGKQIWTKKKRGGAPITVGGDYLYFNRPHKFLDAIDISGKFLIESAPFPGGLGDDKLEFFFPRKNDFFAVFFDNDQHDHQQGDENPPPIQPKLNLVKNRYPITYGDWHETLPASDHLRPLYLPKKNILSLLIEDKHIRIDLETEKRLSEVTLGVGDLVDWSMDQNEVFYVLASDKSHPVLVAYKLTGAEQGKFQKMDLWRWRGDVKTEDAWLAHPPAVGPSGKVYVLTTSRLLALENGKLNWQHEVKTAKDEMSFITVLSDDSLLLASGKGLSYFSSNGKLRWRVEAPGEILSSPVADENGNIFVATATELIRIN